MATWHSAKHMANGHVLSDPNASDAAKQKAAHTMVGVQAKHNARTNKERAERKERNARRLETGAAIVGKLGKGWLW